MCLLQVIGQGSIQKHNFRYERNGNVLRFRVTHAMVPKVKVLGVFSRDDGELVADMIEISVRCKLENEVCGQSTNHNVKHNIASYLLEMCKRHNIYMNFTDPVNNLKRIFSAQILETHGTSGLRV